MIEIYYIEDSVIEYEECQDSGFLNQKEDSEGILNLDFWQTNEEPYARVESLYTQNIEENPNKSGGEENARTTTEEDITMFSRPIYNNFDPEGSGSTKYIGLKTPIDHFETASSNIKRTTGNTGMSRPPKISTEDSRDKIESHPRIKSEGNPLHQYGQILQMRTDSSKTATFGNKPWTAKQARFDYENSDKTNFLSTVANAIDFFSETSTPQSNIWNISII